MRNYWSFLGQHNLRFSLLTFLLIGILIGFSSSAFYVSIITYAQNSSSNVSFQVNASSDDVNEINGSFDPNYGPLSVTLWIGGNTSSYTGLRFQNVAIPKGATITSARVEVYNTSEQWISMQMEIAAENTGNSSPFSSTDLPSQRSMTSKKVNHSSNVKWNTNSWYQLDDIAALIQEVVNRSDWNSGNNLSIILKGAGGQYARKFVKSFDGSSNNAPKLVVAYTLGSNQSTVTSISTATSTVTPTSTPVPTKIPTATPTKIPVITLTESPTPMQSTPTPTSTQTSLEYGTWVPNGTGITCTKAQHDAYYVIGPDGKKYSTYHPVKDPVSGCNFGHDHGDDPKTSIVDSSLPPFGYAAEAAGMFEPHAGFKVFVANAGLRNDEGRTNLHNSRIVFHMGTGGAKRFTTQFHSMEYKVVTNDGRKMFVQGLADIGQVGTICENPRQQRTVMAFGCRLDSSYEIWENKLQIKRNGQVIASAITSTAVFDAITVMDPADKTRLIYTWSDEAKQKIFKFGDDRSYYRGCQREAYHGPTNWYNTGAGSTTLYYTDAYGNVVPNGQLKQEISQHGYTNFVATNDGLSQFKYRKSHCQAGIGLSN